MNPAAKGKIDRPICRGEIGRNLSHPIAKDSPAHNRATTVCANINAIDDKWTSESLIKTILFKMLFAALTAYQSAIQTNTRICSPENSHDKKDQLPRKLMPDGMTFLLSKLVQVFIHDGLDWGMNGDQLASERV